MELKYNGHTKLIGVRCDLGVNLEGIDRVTVHKVGQMSDLGQLSAETCDEGLILLSYGEKPDITPRLIALAYMQVHNGRIVATMKSKTCPQFNVLNLITNKSDHRIFMMSGKTLKEIMACHKSGIESLPMTLAIKCKIIEFDCLQKSNWCLPLGYLNMDIPIDIQDILIIIPSRNPENLSDLISRLGYSRCHICLAIHTRDVDKFKEYFKGIKLNVHVKYMIYDYEFNYSRIHNEVIRANMLDYGKYLLVNDDISGFGVQDIWKMINPLMHSLYIEEYKVGITGAKLIYTGTNEIQHGGVDIDMNRGALHRYRKRLHKDGEIGYYEEMEAVTFALAGLDLSCFIAIGGFDENLPFDFNDTDYCLKARKAGYRVVYNSDCVVYHGESITRKVDGCCGVSRDIKYFKTKWGIK